MGPIDRFLVNLPGTRGTKVFVVVSIVLVATAIPIFGGEDTRKGHDYLSQEKPEGVHQSQEKQRKEYRLARKAERLQRLAEKKKRELAAEKEQRGELAETKQHE
jgi:hypothetical protein